ncbi:response regulator [Pedobacter sp. PWIIR3]
MKRICLHEPDAAIFEIVTLTMQEEGYQIRPLLQPDHPKFIFELNKFCPELVIMDFYRDLNASIAWCKSVRSVVAGICIVAFSCNNDIDQTYRSMGFDAYLKKPFDISQMTGLVQRCVARKQQGFQTQL